MYDVHVHYKFVISENDFDVYCYIKVHLKLRFTFPCFIHCYRHTVYYSSYHYEFDYIINCSLKSVN